MEQKWVNDLVIVRHGESERNVARALAQKEGRGSYGGPRRDPDIELTARGVEQARVTGAFLAGRHTFDVVYVSPYVRTRQTADHILAGFKPRPEMIFEERLREKEFGILDGLTRAGVAGQYPEEAGRKARQGKYYYRPPGGENYPDVNLRVHSFLGTLTREWRRKSVLVVCHSVIVLSLRRLLERLTEDEFLAIDQDAAQDVRNCSITRYTFDPGAGAAGKLVLREFNATGHLRALASNEPSRTSETP